MSAPSRSASGATLSSSSAASSDQALRHAHAVEGRGLRLAGEQGERAAGALEQLAGVPRPLAVDGQTLVLARLDAGRLDLAHLIAQHVELALAVAAGAAQVVELARERAGARRRPPSTPP